MAIKIQQYLSRRFARRFLQVYHFVEALLLSAISIATIIAVFQEFKHIYDIRTVMLSDILLMFIYLEVLAMVQQYITNGKIPVRYPIYIAIIAISRYVTLGMKEMDGVQIIWLALATLILASATVLIRIGHFYWPYKSQITEEE